MSVRIRMFVALCLLLLLLYLSGCGETISGVGKDARRVGKGVRTIFIRDGD